ncbi:hypothetical protein GCM10009753_24540 [Streptantibioticus ferralitis]
MHGGDDGGSHHHHYSDSSDTGSGGDDGRGDNSDMWVFLATTVTAVVAFVLVFYH